MVILVFGSYAILVIILTELLCGYINGFKGKEGDVYLYTYGRHNKYMI